jgi:hypothetical protein
MKAARASLVNHNVWSFCVALECEWTVGILFYAEKDDRETKFVKMWELINGSMKNSLYQGITSHPEHKLLLYVEEEESQVLGDQERTIPMLMLVVVLFCTL